MTELEQMVSVLSTAKEDVDHARSFLATVEKNLDAVSRRVFSEWASTVRWALQVDPSVGVIAMAEAQDDAFCRWLGKNPITLMASGGSPEVCILLNEDHAGTASVEVYPTTAHWTECGAKSFMSSHRMTEVMS